VNILCYNAMKIIFGGGVECKLKMILCFLVYHGEKVVIAKNNLPLVDLVPHKPEGKRQLGQLKGKINIPKNFNKEDPEINEMFYGKDE